MSRSFLYVGGAVLLVVLVLAYAAFSLVESERKVLASAAAEGRALLTAVSAGVRRSVVASRTVERLLGERLLELARDARGEIAAHPGQEERSLRAFASRHKLKGMLLLDASFGVVATAARSGPPSPRGPGRPPPLTAARLQPLLVDAVVRRARERGLGDSDEVVEGFGENPFGARVEYFVGVRMEATGGFLLLLEDAEDLRELREDTGVERVLADAAASDAIAYLVLESPPGTPVASSGRRLGPSPLPPPTPAPSWRESAGGRMLDLAVPTEWKGAGGAVLRVGLDAAPVEVVLAGSRSRIALFTALAILLGAGGAVALTLMDRAGRRKREAYEREIRSGERAAALGRLAAGVAHEVRSPLNAIGMAAQRLSRILPAGDDADRGAGEIVVSMRREVERLNRTVEEFLDLGRARPLQVEDVDLENLVREVVEAEAPAAEVHAPDPAVRLRADPEELRKALANLARNAREAAGDGPVAVHWSAGRTGVRIEVRDGGPGIPDEDRARVFDHFYTTRPGGTGLGLAIVRSIVERHGGQVTVDRAPEGGARFVLFLPKEHA